MSVAVEPVPKQARGRSVIRICLIVENHWRAVMGGAPYQGRVIAESLAARPEFEVFYLARRCFDDADDPYTIVRIGSSAGIRRRAVFFDAPDLWSALKAIDPDVIYQRMRQSYTAVAALYARRYAKRFVFHAASDYDVMPGRFRKHLSLNTPFDWAEGVLGEFGLRRAGAIVTQTQRQADLLRDKFALRAAAVIPNMHPEPGTEESDLRKPDSTVQVAWVANFKLVKRPEHFVQLAEDLKDNKALRFVMAGRAGHERTYRGLHQKISSLANLDYLGELSHDEVNVLLKQSHFLVNTSDVEGFSNTFIQAWMRDTAILSMKVDVDGAFARRGLGYLAGSYEELRRLLVELSADPTGLFPTLRRARDFALEHYSTRKIDQLIDVLTRGLR